MDVLGSTARAVARSAEAALATAGAVGGAAVNGVLGGLRGTVDGVRNGVDSGSHSTPAAVLTLAAIGATGVVEWPVLLGVGGTALVLRRLREPAQPASTPRPAAVLDDNPPPATASAPVRKTAKATGTVKASTAKATESSSSSPARKAASTRRTPAKRKGS
jgi:hypothetical protein